MKIKVSELTDRQIDWLVAKCEGVYLAFPVPLDKGCTPFQPSTDWAQGGPLIEREKINVEFSETDTSDEPWAAWRHNIRFRFGPTSLIAAMRCYVASKLGDEVDIPEELT